MSSSVQSHGINDILCSNSTINTDQIDFPSGHRIHNSPIPPQSVSSNNNQINSASSSSSSCTCNVNHFHHGQHHHFLHHHHHPCSTPSLADSINGNSNHKHHHQHFTHHQLPQAPLINSKSCTSSHHDDNERHVSGETHVAVTVHHHNPTHQYQTLDDNNDDSCDCNQTGQNQSGRSSRLASGDDIPPISSEDNSSRICIHKKNRVNLVSGHRHRNSRNSGPPKRSSVVETSYSSQIEVYSDGTDSGVKITDGGTSEEDQGPPLPPRPPPRPRNVQINNDVPHSTGVKKYVVWCLICGGFSCLLGIMFLGIYFLLRSYTTTVGYFETVPTFIPATLLILTGLCIMSLARRKNRYSYLIKLSGACGLASALTCALVTVTTTVLHMSRLQALRECEYTQRTRTCTCYSVMIESQMEANDDGLRFVFDSTADCGVIHGALYSCLRAVFGLSVGGVLVAVFSCMLVYQLLSHERKKMYWEQLELRCRSLYSSQPAPTIPPGAIAGPSIIGAPNVNACRCCEQCHSHRTTTVPTTYPWDGENRFWPPGQPGNFYSPNPGSEDPANARRNINQRSQRSRGVGWSWPRMPWQRNEPNRFHQTPSSPDSQYGFSNTPVANESTTIPSSSQASYSVIGSLPYGVWGPPPPYSDPNSPARRGRCQYMHSNQCQSMMDHQVASPEANITSSECHQHTSSIDSHSMEPFCPQQSRNVIKRQSGFKAVDNYENTPSDSDGPRDRFSNTLPVRKIKKRVEIGAKSIGPNNQQTNRVNVQNVFNSPDEDHEYQEPGGSNFEQRNITSSAQNCQHKSKRLKTGIENCGFQNIENNPNNPENCIRLLEPTESEVYFADVSSCCNNSVKNDNCYDDANHQGQISVDVENTNKFIQQNNDNDDDDEDYLVQRFGNREASVRNRLPFSQIIQDNYKQSTTVAQMNIPPVAPRTSLLEKDISIQSMCSLDSTGEKTDFTDLSPVTPSTNFSAQNFSSSNNVVNFNYNNNNNNHIDNINNNINNGNCNRDTSNQEILEMNNSNFISSYPFSSNDQSQEALKRSTKNLQELCLAPDAQYECIDDSNSTSTLNYDHHQDVNFSNGGCSFNSSNNGNKPSHSLNITPIKRHNLGTNISTIIQNLGGNDAGLLYPDQ